MKSVLLKIGVLALSLAVPFMRAQSFSGNAPPIHTNGCNFSSGLFAQRLVVADFNDDQKPDSISMRSLGQRQGQNTFSLRICDSGHAESLLTVDSRDPSIIVNAIDVNHDRSPDIVIEQIYTRKRIQVWLNDGHGRFHKAHEDAFRSADTQALCTMSASAGSRGNSPLRAQLRRGTKLKIQIAGLPITSCKAPHRNPWLPILSVQKELGGPNFSRAPPVSIHL